MFSPLKLPGTFANKAVINRTPRVLKNFNRFKLTIYMCSIILYKCLFYGLTPAKG